MDENTINLNTELIQSITPEQAWHYEILPKQCNTDILELYCVENEDNYQKKEELEIILGRKVVFINISQKLLKQNLSKYYILNKKSQLAGRTNSSLTFEDQKNSNEFLFKLISEANSLSCSDIHIETYDNNSRIRFRMDGKLFERCLIKKTEYPALINQIKILSNLDIAEKRLPQDGRIQFKSGKDNFDIRVSIVPGAFGEKVVLRLLRKSGSDIGINTLGFNQIQLDNYLMGIQKPHGLILISGPTGSGKTTTLYATLNVLNKKTINILTIEDPVEYTIEGINQVQLREDIGLTFSRALKTFLRQDPDIIMLGEIRDQETAHMAIRAALTGHLVLSTIHTNSAWGIITRLLDMGIPSFLLASTMNMVLAQRLLRKLCPKCKEQKKLDIESLPLTSYKPDFPCYHYVPIGCEYCFNTGYFGRIAVYEVIPIDNELRELIRNSKISIDSYLHKMKILALSEASLQLFKDGITSFDEIFPILTSV